MKDEIINKQIRCPRLGHELTLSYCLKEAGDFPCSRVISCWSMVFDVTAFLKEELGARKWGEFVNYKPHDKIATLMETIEKAKRRT